MGQRRGAFLKGASWLLVTRSPTPLAEKNCLAANNKWPPADYGGGCMKKAILTALSASQWCPAPVSHDAPKKRA
jgi:hypothetical protein